MPDLLYARRPDLDAWLHFVEDLARLTARKVAADFAVPVGNGGGWDDVNAGWIIVFFCRGDGVWGTGTGFAGQLNRAAARCCN